MRLLLADFHHLGDLVLTWPFQRGAVAAGHTLHVTCRPPAEALQKLAFPEVPVTPWAPPWHDESPAGGRRGLIGQIRAIHAFAQDLKAQKYEAAVGIWPDPRVGLLFRLAEIPVRIGLPSTPANLYASAQPHRKSTLRQGQLAEHLTNAIGQPLLTHHLNRPQDGIHQLDLWQAAARHLDFTTNLATPWITPPSTPTPLPAPSPPQFLLHPGGRLPTKRWPIGHFQQVAGEFLVRQPAWQVVWLQGPGDPDLPASCLQTGRVVVVTTFSELAEVICGCSLLLGNDSFPAHFAAALGVSTLTLFGSADPAWFAPGGNIEATLSTSLCPYRPCLDLCRQPSLICLESIEPGSVLAKLKPLTGDKGKGLG